MAADAHAGAPADTLTPAERQAVLLVEDDRVQQILLEAMLECAGCIVHRADDGLAAMELWRQHRHRLVFTDLQMPVMGGMDFARWLRAQPHGRAVHLVGISADLGDIDLATSAGISRLLHKPVLQASIDEVVRAAQRAAAS